MVPPPRVLMPSLSSRYVAPKRGRWTAAASLRCALPAIAFCAFSALTGCSRQGDRDLVAVAAEQAEAGRSSSSIDAARESWTGWRGGALAGVARDDDLPVQF